MIQEQILGRIENANYPLSSRQLALHLGYSWNTIQQHCLELLIRKKVGRIEIPTLHLWISVKDKKEHSKAIEKALDEEIEKTAEELLSTTRNVSPQLKDGIKSEAKQQNEIKEQSEVLSK